MMWSSDSSSASVNQTSFNGLTPFVKHYRIDKHPSVTSTFQLVEVEDQLQADVTFGFIPAFSLRVNRDGFYLRLISEEAKVSRWQDGKQEEVESNLAKWALGSYYIQLNMRSEIGWKIKFPSIGHVSKTAQVMPGHGQGFKPSPQSGLDPRYVKDLEIMAGAVLAKEIGFKSSLEESDVLIQEAALMQAVRELESIVEGPIGIRDTEVQLAGGKTVAPQVQLAAGGTLGFKRSESRYGVRGGGAPQAGQGGSPWLNPGVIPGVPTKATN